MARNRLHRPPTLRRRLALQIALSVAATVLLALGAIRGVNGLHQDLGSALSGYRELRRVYGLGFLVSGAKSAMQAHPADQFKALSLLRSARKSLDSPTPDQAADAAGVEEWLPESAPRIALLRSGLDQAIALLLEADTTSPARDDPAMQLASIDGVMKVLLAITNDVRGAMVSSQTRADERRWRAVEWVSGLALLAVAAALIIGIRQYRSVMGPLDRLEAACRRIAAGELHDRARVAGDREFVELAEDFNQMAQQLEALYRDLERQVEAKSRELVRSERLASVGYLAAGVAHEINNPLGIISGYGERALELLELLEPAPAEPTLARVRKALGVVCEEAFRCKQITDRLLSLARPGNDQRRPVALRALAREVIGGVDAFKQFADRAIELQAEGEDEYLVLAKDGEMKQVLLNLTLNALEATAPGGSVRVALRRADSSVVLDVIDSGRGMTADTLSRVFEPFFTDPSRQRSGRPGTGLGLSITHAIVLDHGGSISAFSEGPGRGSRFTVVLPEAS